MEKRLRLVFCETTSRMAVADLIGNGFPLKSRLMSFLHDLVSSAWIACTEPDEREFWTSETDLSCVFR